DHLRMQDVARVGGKNASLGEMISQLAPLGVRVPGGFATTASAFRDFVGRDGLDRKIDRLLTDLDVDAVRALAEGGAKIRRWMVEAPFPERLEAEVRKGYAELRDAGASDLSFAVRS